MRSFSEDEERRFRRYHAELAGTTDLWTSSILLLGMLTLLFGRMPYVGTKEAFPAQLAVHVGMFAAHSLPLLVVWTKGRQHYVRWRWAYSLALAMDCIALLVFRCWDIMPDVQSGETGRLVMLVLNSGPIHLLMLSLGRSLLFRHQLGFQTAILLASWVGEWRHCATFLRCRYQADFGWAAEALRWVALPLFIAANVPVRGLMPAAGAAQQEGSGGELQRCMRDCFVVHATTIAVAGYLVPLIIVYKREQHLRRRFLVAIESRPHAPHQALGLTALDQALLLLLTMSWMCWVVRYLAEGGMHRLVGTWEEACPGALW